jgi:hypothetical protein
MGSTDGNGYPTPDNSTGTRIKWRKVWLRKIPTDLLIGKNPDPSGQAEAGLEVLNPYPPTRRPGYVMWTLYVIVWSDAGLQLGEQEMAQGC